jgi:hypothetical protein
MTARIFEVLEENPIPMPVSTINPTLSDLGSNSGLYGEGQLIMDINYINKYAHRWPLINRSLYNSDTKCFLPAVFPRSRVALFEHVQYVYLLLWQIHTCILPSSLFYNLTALYRSRASEWQMFRAPGALKEQRVTDGSQTHTCLTSALRYKI